MVRRGHEDNFERGNTGEVGVGRNSWTVTRHEYVFSLVRGISVSATLSYYSSLTSSVLLSYDGQRRGPPALRFSCMYKTKANFKWQEMNILLTFFPSEKR
jgi:hypothetical protein